MKITYVEFWKDGIYTVQYAILFSTDLNLKGERFYLYYKSRFQIEFLTKQYSVLNHCRGQRASKLHFHFNASPAAVSLAKANYYLAIEKEQRDSLSMNYIKTLNANTIIADRIFSNSDLGLHLEKNKNIYPKVLFLGSIYAKTT